MVNSRTLHGQWFRTAQNVRLYYYTRKRFPALWNAAKFGLVLAVSSFGVFQPSLTSSQSGVNASQVRRVRAGALRIRVHTAARLQVTWIALFIVSSFLMFLWEVKARCCCCVRPRACRAASPWWQSHQ